MKQISPKNGTITAYAAARSGKENSEGTPQTCTCELAPTYAGMADMKTRRLSQGSLIIKVNVSNGTIIRSR